jgi:cellulose synthase/poly-beta-1,6-N-acetylglucosamine synthase-like glycosyltransferase
MNLGLLALIVLMFGCNTVFWSTVGITRTLRRRFGRRHPAHRRPWAHKSPWIGHIPTRDDVAILMAAHNEASVIGASVRTASKLVPPEQIFVVSDGSSDDTVAIVRSCGANVLDLQPNRGKASALAAAVNDFALAERFEVVLILDADTELASNYLETGLSHFADKRVAVVAGRATTQWNPKGLSLLSRGIVAHRERIYVALQWLVKYGQAATRFDAVTIAPGFASMYRSSVLAQVDIDPPGLVIEDFNMTFEIHRRHLGRIEFNPGAAVAHTQDPHTLRDYRKQTRRWSLGFWQTVRLHGLLHRGMFWPLLTLYCVELFISAAALLATWTLVFTDLVLLAVGAFTGVSIEVGPPVLVLLAVLLLPDLILTLLVVAFVRHTYLLLAYPAYPALRVLDACTCLSALASSFWAKSTSTGQWQSPERRVEGQSQDPAAAAGPSIAGGTA